MNSVDVAGRASLARHEQADPPPASRDERASPWVSETPALPTWFSGREAIADLLRTWPLSGERPWRLVPTCVDRQLAFGPLPLGPGPRGASSHPESACSP